MAIKTLLVDDEGSFLDQAERFLQKIDLKIELLTAISAEKGFEIIKEKNLDVIVSDYQMPDMDGIEFLKKVREDGREIPFIMLTGMGREKTAMEAMNNGANGYLKKEGDTEAMYDLLTNVIHREYDRWKTERKFEENKRKIEELHWVASKLIRCDEEEGAYSLAMDAAEKILDYDYCGISEVVNGVFERKAVTSNFDPKNLAERPVEEGGIDKATWVDKEKFMIDDIEEVSKADPVIQNHDFRSLLSLPVDDIGVFQAISEESSYFDESDLKMAELLISHLSNALKRIKAKKELTRKEELYRNTFETTGSAMALVDEDMKITLANQEFNKLFGHYEGDIEEKNFLDFIVQEDEHRVKRYCKELKEDLDKFPVQFDIQINTKKDEVRHVFVTLGYTDEVERFVFSLLESAR